MGYFAVNNNNNYGNPDCNSPESDVNNRKNIS